MVILNSTDWSLPHAILSLPPKSSKWVNDWNVKDKYKSNWVNSGAIYSDKRTLEEKQVLRMDGNDELENTGRIQGRGLKKGN